MIQRNLLAIGVCLTLGMTTVSAQDDEVEPTDGYVGADGSVVVTGLDGCLRTGTWSEDNQINSCEGIEDEEEVEEVAEVEAEPEPEPEPEPVARLTTQDMEEEALFEFDSATMTSAGMAAMDHLFEELAAFEDVTDITVTGYTDSTGPEDYNMTLSEERAAAVADVLQEQYPDVNMTVVGKGEADPVASNDTAEGRAMNRRVEVDVTATKTTFE